MPRGRKPKPQPAATAKAPPVAPAHLSDAARVEFDRLAAYLAGKRLVTDEDADAIEVYAGSLVLYREAQRHLDTEGAVVDGLHGVKVKSPWLTVQNSAWDRFRPLLASFGLTPADRARLKVDAAPDAAADFFGGKR